MGKLIAINMLIFVISLIVAQFTAFGVAPVVMMYALFTALTSVVIALAAIIYGMW